MDVWSRKLNPHAKRFNSFVTWCDKALYICSSFGTLFNLTAKRVGSHAFLLKEFQLGEKRLSIYIIWYVAWYTRMGSAKNNFSKCLSALHMYIHLQRTWRRHLHFSVVRRILQWPTNHRDFASSTRDVFCWRQDHGRGQWRGRTS